MAFIYYMYAFHPKHGYNGFCSMALCMTYRAEDVEATI